MFSSTLNELIKDIEKDKSILKSFNVFKNTWLKNLEIHNPTFYENTKFKKHINKRLYDAYIKLKEKYENT